jgi:hypothetical protein
MGADDLVAVADRMLTTEIAQQMAEAYSDVVVFPQRRIIVGADGEEAPFPGCPDRVLLLSHENQGVCSWGLVLDGPSAGSIVVGGDLPEGVATAACCADLPTFVAMRLWDGRCLATAPLLQAQAAPLDDETLAVLRTRLGPLPSTLGWPGRSTLRFEADDLQVMLWSDLDQCDWWVSGNQRAVAGILPQLMTLSSLSNSLWSNDETGIRLLSDARA